MHAITASRMYCGVVGGSLIRGVLKDGNDLEIQPGLQIQAVTADSSLGHSMVLRTRSAMMLCTRSAMVLCTRSAIGPSITKEISKKQPSPSSNDGLEKPSQPGNTGSRSRISRSKSSSTISRNESRLQLFFIKLRISTGPNND